MHKKALCLDCLTLAYLPSLLGSPRQGNNVYSLFTTCSDYIRQKYQILLQLVTKFDVYSVGSRQYAKPLYK